MAGVVTGAFGVRLSFARDAAASEPAVAARQSIAVYYPALGDPFRLVFASIIEGIEAELGAPVDAYAVSSSNERAVAAELLRRNKTRVVIALGRQGVHAAGLLPSQIGVIVGGVLLQDAEQKVLSGSTFTPDPAALFAQLRRLSPQTRRIHVVYDPQNNEWLIRLARDAARALGMELVSQEARDPAGAARLYEALLAGADARRDALWLPYDVTTVEETTIVPLVLRESWNRSLPVFSSSYLHAKKGALFSMYPDNAEHGKALAGMASRALAGELRLGAVPLRQVHVALNVRTANHLGINLSFEQRRAFDALFPEN